MGSGWPGIRDGLVSLIHQSRSSSVPGNHPLQYTRELHCGVFTRAAWITSPEAHSDRIALWIGGERMGCDECVPSHAAQKAESATIRCRRVVGPTPWRVVLYVHAARIQDDVLPTVSYEGLKGWGDSWIYSVARAKLTYRASKYSVAGVTVSVAP